MVYVDNLLNYTDWKINLKLHTDAYDIQLGAVIIKNNKPLAFFPKILIKSQSNYNTPKKKIISIFGYVINIFHTTVAGA